MGWQVAHKMATILTAQGWCNGYIDSFDPFVLLVMTVYMTAKYKVLICVVDEGSQQQSLYQASKKCS
jgi:hypothetical protein